MATSLAPAQLVTGAAYLPLPYGLFSVLSWRTTADPHWRAGGVSWETATCEPVGVIGAPTCASDDITGVPLSFDTAHGEVASATPFMVYGRHRCSPIGDTFAAASERAALHLARGEQTGVEKALWGGAAGNSPKLSAASSLGTVQLTEDGLLDGIGQLEQHLAEEYGGQGVIHLNRHLATVVSGKLVERGGRLLTPLGTAVVAGAGYGSGAIVITPQLVGYRSEVEQPGQPGADLFDRTNNDLYALAMRTYLVGYESCGVASVTITT